MIHYHGTPMGGNRGDVLHFLQGRHALVPFPRQDDMATVAAVCAGFVLDNGAYTYWRKGYAEYPDYDGYVAWVEQWHTHPGFRWAIIPDHIAGDEAANNAYLARWPKHLKGVPVFHMHHSLERLVWLAQNYEVVALGGSSQYPLKSPAWWQRLYEMMDAVTDEQGRPLCELHGLRMLDPRVFTLLPLASGDSTNAARNSCTPDASGASRGERACRIADRVESYDSAPTWARRRRAPAVATRPRRRFKLFEF